MTEASFITDGIPVIFFHAVSPPRYRLIRLLFKMLAPFNIVYNTVDDIIIIIEYFSRFAMLSVTPGGQRAIHIGEIMAGKPSRHAVVRASKSLQVPTPTPLAREPAAIVIAKRIEEDIVLGRRQPRERLVEQDLCNLFQTHRGDVRLALFELEKNGLVERIPNRGALVRGLTPLEVKEIYSVREELEVMAVRIVPFPVGHEDIERLEQLQRQHTAAIAAGDLLTVFYSNLSFHQVLFGLCGNACLIETIDWLAQKVYGIRSYANAFPESLDRARRDHLDMIKALRGSRRDDLVALTRRHLKPSPEAYIKAYQRRFGAPA